MGPFGVDRNSWPTFVQLLGVPRTDPLIRDIRDSLIYLCARGALADGRALALHTFGGLSGNQAVYQH